MNPADSEPDVQVASLRHAVTSKGAMIGHHDQTLRGIMDSLANLTSGLSRLENRLQNNDSPVSPSPAAPVGAMHPREPSVPAPERYDGTLGICKSFLFQCSLVFELQPATYNSDRAKIAYVLGLLTGRAKACGTAFWHNPLTIRATFQQFSAEMLSVFDHPLTSCDASNQLLSLSQGSQSAANYSVEFRTLAAELGWDDVGTSKYFCKRTKRSHKRLFSGQGRDEEPTGAN